MAVVFISHIHSSNELLIPTMKQIDRSGNAEIRTGRGFQALARRLEL